MINQIFTDEELVAIYVAKDWDSDSTQFLTENDMQMQLGIIVSHAGEQISPHRHKQKERKIQGTSEFLLLKQGSCYADFFDKSNALVQSIHLNTGDMLLILGGAHGFRGDTEFKFIEVKQGPYLGAEDKERLDGSV